MDGKYQVAGWNRQSPAAYIAFKKGYKSEFAYFTGTIDSFEDYVEAIDKAINNILRPVLFGQYSYTSANLTASLGSLWVLLHLNSNVYATLNS